MYDNSSQGVGFTYLTQMKPKAWFWKKETRERHSSLDLVEVERESEADN
jgi:hypothetical protein